MQSRRNAFTLVEMVVVLVIVLLAATVTALVLPGILRNEKVTQGANMIQGMLLAAKQRAVRDQVPCGVRFVSVTDPLVSTRTICTEMFYITQPDDFYIASDTISIGTSTVTSLSGDFSGGLGATAPLLPEVFPVQAGDFLMTPYPSVSVIARISDVSQVPTGAGKPFNTLTVSNIISNGATVTPPGTSVSYGILRGPRRVIGEDSVKLPSDVVVLISDTSDPKAGSVCIPSRSVLVSVNGVKAASATTYSEVLFGPAGSMIGSDSGSSPGSLVKLWVWDSSRDNLTDGEPAYVVIRPGTGSIAVQPVDVSKTGGVYDGFTTDLHTSGF